VIQNAGDKKTEYQACEGLSSVQFQQQKYDHSCEYLQKALTAASGDTSEQSAAAQQRIARKLTTVIQIDAQQTPVCIARDII